MDTEERLEKLEREVFVWKRRTCWLLAVVLVGFVGVGLALTWERIRPTAHALGSKVIRDSVHS